jgi:hypothetical protein
MPCAPPASSPTGTARWLTVEDAIPAARRRRMQSAKDVLRTVAVRRRMRSAKVRTYSEPSPDPAGSESAPEGSERARYSGPVLGPGARTRYSDPVLGPGARARCSDRIYVWAGSACRLWSDSAPLWQTDYCCSAAVQPVRSQALRLGQRHCETVAKLTSRRWQGQ